MTKKQSSIKRKVHFEPNNIDIIANPGDNLLETAIDAGVHINASCGGNGVCGTCKVLIKKGEVESNRTEKLSEEEWAQGVRQACQSRLITDLTVHIPVASRLDQAVIDRERQEAVDAVATGWNYSPIVSKCRVKLPAPSSGDNISDLNRLIKGIKKSCNVSNVSIDFNMMETLPGVLRQGDFEITVTSLVTALKSRAQHRRKTRVTKIEPGDTVKRNYSLAFDVGTTTVCGQLLDLSGGKIVAQHIEYNQQISYGGDVISRIAYCEKPGGLKKLQRAVVDTINTIIKRLVDESGIDINDIGHMMIAANTTMTHILLGLTPKYIRLAPYTPVANLIPPLKASYLGINVSDNVYLNTAPMVASYVGGDIISGIIGSGMYQRQKLTLYIDIGTNGEVVVGNSEWMVVASCSAGPAFEGGGIKHGMVATAGAIEDFHIDPSTLEPVVSTIGDSRAKGICGSGLINIVAGLQQADIIGANGKFNVSSGNKRVRPGVDGYEYVLSWAAETETGQDIVITEVDIDNLIRAKAAMYAGCETLVRSVGLGLTDIEQVIIAGTFGNRIDIEKSIAIGLFPDMPRERYIYIGNGSLTGARLVSFSMDLLDDARRVAGMVTNIELSESVDFMNNYVAAMFLPHTSADNFPTVSQKKGGARLTN